MSACAGDCGHTNQRQQYVVQMMNNRTVLRAWRGVGITWHRLMTVFVGKKLFDVSDCQDLDEHASCKTAGCGPYTSSTSDKA